VGVPDDTAFATATNQRVNELRLAYPQIHGVTEDLLFVAYLLATARFGRFAYGPINIDVGVVEERFVRTLPSEAADGPHRLHASARAFYARLAEELSRAGTKRANELHYLLAFMRSRDSLAASVFGELGVRPKPSNSTQKSPGPPRSSLKRSYRLRTWRIAWASTCRR
jgi:hypothetical protein